MQGFATADAGTPVASRDTLTGGAGADIFVIGLAGGLGYAGQAGYVPGNALTDGVVITDYLDGNINDLIRITDAGGGINQIVPQGAGVYELQNGGGVAQYVLNINGSTAYLGDAVSGNTLAQINKGSVADNSQFVNALTDPTLANWNFA